MKNKILKIYQKAQFYPNFISLFVNPFFIARRGLHKAIVSKIKCLDGKLLDVGCGSKPYKSITSAKDYVGLEIDSPMNRQLKNADYFYNGTDMPFKNSDFDSVLCNQVFEHVFNPSSFLKEINRVLKTGGVCLITVPFIWDEHEQPNDYARYTSFGLKHVLESHGFTIIEFEKINNGFQVLFQLINCYIYKKSYSRSFILNVLVCIFFCTPFSILGYISSILLPKNDDLYLDNIILAKKVKNV